MSGAARPKPNVDLSVDRYEYLVTCQQVFISTLRNEDARLHGARLLLRSLQQNLAAAELGQAIRNHQNLMEMT